MFLHTIFGRVPFPFTGEAIHSVSVERGATRPGLPGGTTSSIDLQKVDASKKSLVLRAYNQQGRLVSHYNVDAREAAGAGDRRHLRRQSGNVDEQAHRRSAVSLLRQLRCGLSDSGITSRINRTTDPRHGEPMPKLTPVVN